MNPSPSAPCTGRDSDGVFVAVGVDSAGGAAEAGSGRELLRLLPKAEIAARITAALSTTIAAPVRTSGTRLRPGLAGVGGGGGYGL